MFRVVARRLRAVLRRAQIEQELDQEIRFHVEKEIEQNVAKGMTYKEARRAALRDFGGVERYKEEAREARGIRLLEESWQDVRYGARILRRSPGFAAVAILTLGLGVGACAAIFSVVNGVLLRPLPFPEPDRVVVIRESFPPTLPDSSVASGKFLNWQKQATSFESLGFLGATSYNLTGAGAPVHLHAAHIGASLLSTLRLGPLLGRNFTPEEQLPRDQQNVAILSFGLWRRHFNGRSDVLNQTIQLNGRAHTVVGVMPPESGLPEWAEVFVPAGFRVNDQRNYASWHGLYVVGRLKPGITPTQAQSELRLLDERTAQAHPESRGWIARVTPLFESVVGKVRPLLFALLGAVGFLLLIVCANVANLLLARATSRSKEMAVRVAVGASRARILRQVLVESMVLSLLGALLGVLIAKGGVTALLALAPQTLPRAAKIAVDGSALGVAVALAVLTGIAFGLVPALQVSRVRLHETLKQSARGASEGGQRQRLRGALIVGEMAVALVLLAGAGLLTRSFARLQEVSPGFNARNVHVAEIFLPRPEYTSPAQYVRFAEQTMAEIAAKPEVQAVAVSANIPFSDHHMTLSMTVHFSIPGRPLVTNSEMPVSNYYAVSKDYFRAMGIPLLRGRPFDDRDRFSSTRVVIIGESLATRFFPGEDPLGKVIAAEGRAPYEIVGVAGDVKTNGLDGDGTLQLYVPFTQEPDNDIIYVVRTAESGAAWDVFDAVRTAVAHADATVPIYSPRPLAALVGASIGRQRFAMTLFAIFSAVALLLAAIGVYGVMAYSVAQRTGEIGIRMALGAQTRDVMGLMVRQGGRLIALGVIAGVIGGLMLSRFLEKMLFHLSAHDPVTFVAIVVLLVMVAGLACVLPARRASKVNPMIALRAE
jgi:predicted permease